MLERLNISDFDEFYEILDDSFPENEKRPYKAEKDLFSREDFTILVWREENRIQGFISIYDLPDFIFIEHLATGREYRNQGLGARILSELALSTDKRLCLEAEPPISDMAKRRIGFYIRNGFYYNDHFYIQPPLFCGQDEVELRIMMTGSPLSNEEFERVRDILYKYIYGIK